MKHPVAQQWVDQARGVLPRREAEALQQHLAAGCPDCRRTADVMAALARVAEREAAYEVPDAARKRVLGLFPPRREQSSGGLERIVAQLVYDSLRDPLPAGVRAANRASQALYRAGDVFVDLHINREMAAREAGGPRLIVVGQLADRSEAGTPLRDRPVLLLCGRQVAARTLSNDLGEFHLESDPGPRYRLQIWLDAVRHLELPVSEVTGPRES